MAKCFGEVTKKGVFFVMSSRMGVGVVRFISSIILARLLSPEDFGIMGIAVFFIHVAKRIERFGLGPALIQKENLTDDHVSTVMIANLVLSIVLYIGMLIVSPFIGKWFHNPLLTQILIVLSIVFILSALTTAPQAYLDRKFKYAKSSLGYVNGEIFDIGISILFAYLGYKCWSLVFGYLGGNIALLITVYIFSKWKFRFRYNHTIMKELTSFSSWIFIRTQLMYFCKSLPTVLIGKEINSSAAGYYERGINLIDAVQTLIVRPIGSVLFPVFSRMQSEQERIRIAYQKTLLSVSLMNYPCFIGILLVAPILIPVLYGEKWMPAVLPLQILCIYAIVESYNIIGTSIITAKNAVKPHAITQIIYLLLLISIIFVAQYGLPFVALIVVFSNIINLLIVLRLIKRITGIGLKDFFAVQIPPLVYTIIMVVVVKLLEGLAVKFYPKESILMLIFLVAMEGIVYFAAFYFIRFKAVDELRKEALEDIESVFLRLKSKFRHGSKRANLG